MRIDIGVSDISAILGRNRFTSRETVMTKMVKKLKGLPLLDSRATKIGEDIGIDLSKPEEKKVLEAPSKITKLDYSCQKYASGLVRRATGILSESKILEQYCNTSKRKATAYDKSKSIHLVGNCYLTGRPDARSGNILTEIKARQNTYKGVPESDRLQVIGYCGLMKLKRAQLVEAIATLEEKEISCSPVRTHRIDFNPDEWQNIILPGLKSFCEELISKTC